MNVLRLGFQGLLLAGTLGVGLLLYAVLGRGGEPEKVSAGEVRGRVVRVMVVRVQDYQAPLIAYGTARAPRIHAIRPQIGRRVAKVSDRFVEGRRIEMSDLLFSMDGQDLEVLITESKARIREIEASLINIERKIQPLTENIRSLEQELIDLEKSLSILDEAVALARSDVTRLTRLSESGAASVQSLEAARQRLNQHEQALTPPQSRRNQIPIAIRSIEAEIEAIRAERDVLEARKEVAQAALSRARLDLDRTQVRSPVDGIVLLRDPETGLTVKALTTDDVLLPGQDVGWIVESGTGIDVPVAVDLTDILWLVGQEGTEADAISRLAEREFGEVQVQWYRKQKFAWRGRVDRIREELDEATRTVTFIVRVDQPGLNVNPGTSLPLTRGMFCKVRIPGKPERNSIVIPRSALREGSTVHIVEDGRLTVREIRPKRYTEEDVIIETGLVGGETLILSDIPGAIQGMPIDPVFGEEGS